MYLFDFCNVLIALSIFVFADDNKARTMESLQKKKLAVVPGKRAAEGTETSDNSMEDLCRKKFKPIAPKPIIRKDQHQAMLSTTFPVRDDGVQRKEHAVAPTPKHDFSSMFVMKPGSTMPFMCGGPMIMPIPIPVVPGKDGSYVPLQVPLPIPVMVPVVVSLGQAMSPGASRAPTTVFSDSGQKEGCPSNNQSKKNSNTKKGNAKQDQPSGSGDGADGKGLKVKPCRYKYSMIKNGALFRDLLRGVGGDFMTNHGISISLSSKDAPNVSYRLDRNTGVVQQGQNEDDNDDDDDDDVIESESDCHRQGVTASCPEPSVMQKVSSEDSASKTADMSSTECNPEKQLESNDSNRVHSVQKDGHPHLITTAPHSSVSVTTSAAYHQGGPNGGQYSTPVSMNAATCGMRFTSPQISQSSCAPHSSSSEQSSATVTQNSSLYIPNSSNVGALANARSAETARMYAANSTLTSRDAVVYSSSTHYDSSSNRNNMSSGQSRAMPTPGSYATPRTPSNSTNLMQASCPTSILPITQSARTSQWCNTAGTNVTITRSEHLSTAVTKSAPNLSMRTSLPHNNEQHHLDDSSLYSMDELHTFSVEMDQSSGGLLSSSDDSVSAVLGMSEVGGSVSANGTLSDSPTRRAVTAIVTPLPRSMAITTSASSTSTTVSHASDNRIVTAPETLRSQRNTPITTSMASNQVNQSSIRHTPATISNRQVPMLPSSNQVSHDWSLSRNSSLQQSNVHLTSGQNRSGVHQSHQEPAEDRNHTNNPAQFAVPTTNQQRNLPPTTNQQRSVTVGTFQSGPSAASSTVTPRDQVPVTQNYMTSPRSTRQVSIPYSTGTQTGVSGQRQMPSAQSNNFTSTNVSVSHSSASVVSFTNDARRTNLSQSSQDRSANSLQGSQSMPSNALGGSSTGAYPLGIQNQSRQSQFVGGSSDSISLPNNPNTNQSNRHGESHRDPPHSSGLTPRHANQHGSRPNASQIPVVSSSHSISSGFGSRILQTPNRMASYSSPVTTQSISVASGVVTTTATSCRDSLLTPMWQPSWSGSGSTGQSRPSFQNNVIGQVAGGSSTDRHFTNQTDHSMAARRSDSSNPPLPLSVVQSVPLQSNLQTRSSMSELHQPGPRAVSHTNPPIPPVPDGAGGAGDRVHDSVQIPSYPGNPQRQVPASQPGPMSSTAPNNLSNESGPRMPYPLVPPIMFGNSAPVRGLPVGGIHSGVPLPGRYPNQGIPEQRPQAHPVISSSPLPIHRPVTPMPHDRHRMYLPSQFSTLHHPLYMSPSPVPNADLPLLSPHSYGQLHVHDSVLYSPRYPSSLHSLSPGVSNSFPPSSLSRAYPATDHFDTCGRNHMSHPAPHYDSSVPATPLRVPEVGQGQSGVGGVASSGTVQVPPSIPSFQHSSIVANREQNTLFEKNLQRLLEQRARRHHALATSLARTISCEHPLPHRTLNSLSSFPSFAPPPSTCSVSFSTAPMIGHSQMAHPHSAPRVPSHPTPSLPSHPTPSLHSHSTPILPAHSTPRLPSHSTPRLPSHSTPRLPSQSMPSSQNTASSIITAATTICVTTVSTTATPTTSTIVTSRAILGNMSDKYLPLELVTSESSGSSGSQATPTTTVTTSTAQLSNDQIVKCGDMVLQCSRQVLRESGRTVLCCWFCDYHTAEPRKMKRHQKKEKEPMKCQLCSFQSDSRCSVNQHYKQEHMDKDDPFRTVAH